jgi:hypothetical protein
LHITGWREGGIKDDHGKTENTAITKSEEDVLRHGIMNFNGLGDCIISSCMSIKRIGIGTRERETCVFRR